MKKVFVGILAFILCFCGNIVAQAEWMTIEKNVPELGISFSFPISDNSLYQQRIYVLEKKDDCCTVCDTALESREIPPLGHIEGRWETTRSATCTADGLRTLYCSRCYATMATEKISAFGHSPAEWTYVTAAGCTQSGLKQKYCAECGATLESEIIPATGHSYTDWTVTREPTKKTEGERMRFCILCGDYVTEKIEKLPKVFGIF